ncbi:DUF3618 domain-containing protein [Streptomyces sp. NPDC005574]|uniref:DUF3618 domain-containing protein n=1 Tax=Streptomyces sp. NPDC005574 TaxID=3156891 RepID=UPI0033AD2C5E
MGTSPDQVRAEIEATRGRLSADVDQLTDRTSPRRVVHRRKERMRGAVGGLRDRVMGTASHTSQGVADSAQSAAGSLQEGAGRAADSARDVVGQAGQAVQQAPDTVRSQTQGNPLAAGLVAFGVGLLASSLLPATQAEQDKAADLLQSDALEPVKQAAGESAQHLKEGAKEVTQSAVAEVKDTATQAAQTTQDKAREQAGQVTEQTRDSGRTLADEARQRTGQS